MKLDKSHWILIISLVVLSFYLTRSCQTSASENTYKQNMSALNDSIRSYKAKNGQLIFEKAAFISENGSLKSLNKDLADEVKNLKDNPVVVIKTKTVIKTDTVKVPVYSSSPGTWNSGTFTKNFDWSINQRFSEGNYRELSGDFDVSVDSTYQLSVSELRINKDELGISFTTGLTENTQGLLEIFVKSDYPGFSPESLDGALIDPSKSKVLKKYFPPKRWALGLYAGYGVYVDPIQVRTGTGAQVGIGVQYNLIQWNFKK